MSESVVIEVDNGVGIVTLNRPEQHNAFDDVLVGELTVALQGMEADPGVRVIVLSSTGESFCAGADLKWMRRAAAYSEQENVRDAKTMGNLFRTLNELPKPTIARVQGPAYGGGVGMVACCDIAIATFDAQFAFSEVRMGIIPGVISPYVINAIGERRARRYMLTGERFSASEAYRIGLLHEIVPTDEELDNAIGEVIDDVLAGSPQAHDQCKSLIRAVNGKPVTDQLIEETSRRIARARAGEEGREGIAAFLENRRPWWVTAG